MKLANYVSSVLALCRDSAKINTGTSTCSFERQAHQQCFACLAGFVAGRGNLSFELQTSSN